jgi:hypothetical protein
VKGKRFPALEPLAAPARVGKVVKKGGQTEKLELRGVAMQERACAQSIRHRSVIRIGLRNMFPRTADHAMRAVDRTRVATPPDAFRSLTPQPQQQRARGSSSGGVVRGTKHAPWSQP